LETCSALIKTSDIRFAVLGALLNRKCLVESLGALLNQGLRTRH
jgi:hypothetical protein